jgi:hypothetical protein
MDVFLLNKKCNTGNSIDNSTKSIEYIHFSNQLNNLKKAILWAERNNEDLIFCSICDDNLLKMDYEKLQSIVEKIATESIYLLYVDYICDESFFIDQYLCAVNGIKEVSSFIILRPLFSRILSILENKDLIKSTSIIKILNIISPHYIGVSLKENECKEINDLNIKIISPFRNAKKYINKYFDSLDKQIYKNFVLFLIDDASDDGIDDITKIKKSYLIPQKNIERKYALLNILSVLINQELDDDDVICLIDGDDYLAHRYVLNIVNQVYKNNPELLLTYGSTRATNSFTVWNTPYTKNEFNNIRKSVWKAQPLRTFKYKLFKELLIIDPNLNILRNTQNDFFHIPSDMALLFPLMEIAGYEKCKHISTVLYEYNIHENNDFRIHYDEQKNGDLEIRTKVPIK